MRVPWLREVIVKEVYTDKVFIPIRIGCNMKKDYLGTFITFSSKDPLNRR